MENAKDYNAIVTVVVAAPVNKVWDAITKPELIKQYMHGTNTETDWAVGSPVSWSGEWNGKAYTDKGLVLQNEFQKLLSYTHWSPMGGSEDAPENYHVVTIELTEQNGSTQLTLTQSNNPSQEAADQMASNAWGPMLQALKTIAEN
ncbi:MAG: ATPase [Candidatus Saccharibacteria bacterium]|nr:ATPase [Candidatus Saccharibacteria bacterium]